MLMNGYITRDYLIPTMKPLNDVNKGNDVKNQPVEEMKAEPEKIDFSKVKIEPLFEEQVDFDTFSKSDFRAVKVKECVAVPKSKKLLQFTLDDGTGTDRTILSGIHAYYEPEELVGKTLIAITNLPPRAMMGIDSCGMLLSAIHEEEGEEKLHLLMVDDHIPAGAKLYYDNSISNSINAPLHNDDLSEYYICCNVMNNQWIFFLLCDLEEIFIHTMDCTVLHGAGLVFRNKTILLLGDRKNGKTTLLQYLLSKENSGYMDDDNIFVLHDYVFGFCRPIPIRNIDVCVEPSIISTTIDGDNCTRTLCRTCNNVTSLTKVDYVFFPKYIGKSSTIDTCSKLQGGLFFDKLLKNVRHSTNISTLYSDLKYISMNAKGFYFEYTSSEDAYEIIDDILKS